MWRGCQSSTAIGESDKPDVFARTFGRAETVKVTSRPDLPAQTFDATFKNEFASKPDF